MINIPLFLFFLTISLSFSILFSFLIFRRDYRARTWKELFLTFLLMGIWIYPVLQIEGWIQGLLANETNYYIFGALFEEIVKFVPVAILIIKRKYINKFDIVIYAITAALGFAVFENALFAYFTFINEPNWFVTGMTIATRSIGATIIHVISSSILAICVALGIGNKRLWIWTGAGLLGSAIIHFWWNWQIDINEAVFFPLFVVWLSLVLYIFLFEKLKAIFYGNKFLWGLYYKKIIGLVIFSIIWVSIVYGFVESGIPKYTKSEIDYWNMEYNSFKETQEMWRDIDSPEFKNEINKIDQMHIVILSNIEYVLSRMNNNDFVEPDIDSTTQKHLQTTKELNEYSSEVNREINIDYWMKELEINERARISWVNASKSEITFKKEIENIIELFDTIRSDIKTNLTKIQNDKQIDYEYIISAHNKKINHINSVIDEMNKKANNI